MSKVRTPKNAPIILERNTYFQQQTSEKKSPNDKDDKQGLTENFSMIWI